MILTCPSCEARFLVDAAMIPAEGREVRCAKCGHQWFQEPENDVAELRADQTMDEAEEGAHDEPESTEEDDTGFGAQLDDDIDLDSLSFGSGANDPDELLAGGSKAISAKPLIYVMLLLIMGIAIGALFAFRTTLQPSLGFVYDLMGLHSMEGLVLADVSFRERPSRNKARYVVEGKIINESEEPRRIPILRVAIIDKSGNVIASREYEADGQEKLEPGESYPFKASNLETTFKDRVDHLLVDMGFGTELMLRSSP